MMHYFICKERYTSLRENGHIPYGEKSSFSYTAFWKLEGLEKGTCSNDVSTV